MEHALTQLILLDMRPIVSNFERPISLNGRKLTDGRLQFCTLHMYLVVAIGNSTYVPGSG